MADNQLQMEATATDTNGISRVVFKVDYQNRWHDVQGVHQGGDRWTATWDTSNKQESTIRVQAYAYNHAGNSAASGAATNIQIDHPAPDTTGPEVVIISPTGNEAAPLHNEMDIQFDVSDQSDIYRIRVLVYYKEELGGELIEHKLRIDPKGSQTYNARLDLSQQSHRAIAQNDAYVQIRVWDTAGNQTWSEKVYFNTMVLNHPIRVNATQEWNPHESGMAVDKHGTVIVDNISGSADAASYN